MCGFFFFQKKKKTFKKWEKKKYLGQIFNFNPQQPLRGAMWDYRVVEIIFGFYKFLPHEQG